MLLPLLMNMDFAGGVAQSGPGNRMMTMGIGSVVWWLVPTLIIFG